MLYCRAPWPPQATDAFTTACRTHGVQAPQPAPDHDTALQSSTETAPPLAAARHAAACLREQGYDVPAWDSLLQARPAQEEREFGDFLRGWQHRAALASDKRA